MLIGNNILGKRIHIDDADNNQQYFCPNCKMQLTLKKGEIKAHHFAHKIIKDIEIKDCYLRSKNRMNAWYIDWLNHFPKDNIEILLDKDNQTHIADVLINGVVIQFQQLNLSIEEFREKNKFFNSLGYKVIWMFDLSKEYEKERIQNNPFGNNVNKYHWLHPKKLFKEINIKNEDYQIYFQFTNTIKKINKCEMDFELFYTDNKTFIIDEFINVAINDINILFPNFNSESVINKKEIHYTSIEGKTILELWNKNTKWLIVKNLKTNKIYKLYYDPRNDIKSYNMVYGNLSSGEYYSKSGRRYNFYDNKVKLYDWDKSYWKTIKELHQINDLVNNKTNIKKLNNNESVNIVLPKGKTIKQLVEENAHDKFNIIVRCLIDNTLYNLDFFKETTNSEIQVIPYDLNYGTKIRKEISLESSYYRYQDEMVWELL